MSNINKQADFYAHCVAPQNVDHLLETIGALYTRNKGLQKGHTTLTRRVQELEAQLEAEIVRSECSIAKPQHLNCRIGTVDLGGGFLSMNSGPVADNISHADTQLQADIEALKTRVADMEFAAYPHSRRRQARTESQRLSTEAFNTAVRQLIEIEIDKACRMGGRINRAIR